MLFLGEGEGGKYSDLACVYRTSCGLTCLSV